MGQNSGNCLCSCVHPTQGCVGELHQSLVCVSARVHIPVVGKGGVGDWTSQHLLELCHDTPKQRVAGLLL